MTTVATININSTQSPNIWAITFAGVNDFGVTVNISVRILVNGSEVFPETEVASSIGAGNGWGAAVYIPTDPSGSYMVGDYELHVIVRDLSDALLDDSLANFKFDPGDSKRIAQSLDLTSKVRCDAGRIDFIDSTIIPNEIYNTVTRYWEVNVPALLGNPAKKYTSSYVSFSIPIDYVNVEYQYLYRVIVEFDYVSSGNVQVKGIYMLEEEDSIDIVCPTLEDICEGIGNTLETWSSRCGYNDTKLLKLLALLEMFEHSCDDGNRLNEIKNEIIKHIGCTHNVDNKPKRFILPSGELFFSTGWQNLSLTGGFVVVGVPGFKWRLDNDGNLCISGKMQVPGGLTVGSPVVIATNWAPSSGVYSDVAAILEPAMDAGGVIIGSVSVSKTNGDVIFTPNTNYSGGPEFVYVNAKFPKWQ